MDAALRNALAVAADAKRERLNRAYTESPSWILTRRDHGKPYVHELAWGDTVIVKNERKTIASILWNASLCLSRLLEHKFPLDAEHKDGGLIGRRVVELGAGTGLVSLVASRLGATVACTDLPPALPLLRENVAANARPGAPGSVEVMPLAWAFTSLDELKGPDYIVGADIVYYPGAALALLSTLFQLCADHTVVYLSYGREGRVGVKEFFRLAPQWFHAEEITKPDQHPDFVYDAVAIWSLRKLAAEDMTAPPLPYPMPDATDEPTGALFNPDGAKLNEPPPAAASPCP